MNQQQKQSPVQSQRLLDAQVGVIGSMLIDTDCVGDVLSSITDRNFSGAEYRNIFKVIKALFSEGKPVDPVTVRDKLREEAGADYNDLLLQIMDLTPTAANVMAYADILKRESIVWRLHTIAAQLADTVELAECEKLMEKANAALSDKSDVEIWSMPQAWESFCNRHRSGKAPQYLRFGIPAVDDRVYAEAGDFIILGGYSSDGKTCLSLMMAMEMAKTKRVGFFSFETDKDKLTDRIFTAKAMVNFGKVKKSDLTEDEWENLAYAASDLSTGGLHILQCSGFTVSDIQAVAMSRHFDVVFIDYIQLIRADTSRGWSRTEEVGSVSRGLQQLAHGNGITVVSLSQLTPGDNAKKNEAPTMFNLRENKQIAFDADVVFLLYKEEAEIKNSYRILKCDKNKDGEAGWFTKLAFHGETQTFSRPASTEKYKAPEHDQVTFTEIEQSADMPF